MEWWQQLIITIITELFVFLGIWLVQRKTDKREKTKHKWETFQKILELPVTPEKSFFIKKIYEEEFKSKKKKKLKKFNNMNKKMMEILEDFLEENKEGLNNE